MVLMVCCESLCKEYTIENRETGVTTLIFSKHDFKLAHSVAVQLEFIDGRFMAVCDNACGFYSNGRCLRTIDISSDSTFLLKTGAGEKLRFIFSVSRDSIPVSKKLILNTSKTITIGSDSSNVISYNCHSLVSKRHAQIVFKQGLWYVSDSSTNGTYLNGKCIKSVTRLHFGDIVYIFGLKLIYFGKLLAVSSCFSDSFICDESILYDCSLNRFGVRGSEKSKQFFNRSPRNLPAIYNSSIEIDSPPAAKEQDGKQLFSVVGRPLTMALPMMIGCIMMAAGMSRSGSFMSLGIITALSSAVLGASWALINVRNHEADITAKERTRFNAYGNYLIGISKELSDKYKRNYQAINSMYPSADKCVRYSRNSVGLWNRNPSHDDFLYVRLGLGDIPFQIDINIPKVKFSVIEDKVQSCPSEIQSEYKVLHNVPVGIDLLKNQLIGIVGRKSTSAKTKLAQTIVTQIAANNCYTDVKLVLFNNKKSTGDTSWDFMRFLPHCWSEDKKVRFYSDCKFDIEDISYEILKVLRMRNDNADSSFKKPYYIIILTDPSLLDNSLLLNYIVNPQPAYGITTLILSDSFVSLPNTCRLLLESDGVYCSINEIMDVNRQKVIVAQDSVSNEEIDRFAHRLADIKVEEKETNQAIPTGVDFLSLYNAKTLSDLGIEQRWSSANTSDSISVPVGMKSGGQLFCLDIHEKYHGPHGLVAGTTGSGKSELLQSYILSLSVNFSPEDINFFIIDYKGGGMANLFNKLPHMVGQISNLSGSQIRRALISINSEKERRLRIFSQYGVNGINQYRRMYTEGVADIPIAHLIIIIDEFAELKKAEPEFISELVSIAHVGRSMGIHLILATQKPGGTVDDNIRSNSRFKLCLRVQDRQDSMEMLRKPDAAFITQPGGCIFQVGEDEIFEPFQSAWSGAIYDDSQTGNNDCVKMLTHTGKAAIAGNRMKVKRYEQKKIKWYSRIVSAIRRAAQTDYISEFSGQSTLRLCEKAAELLDEDGIEWTENPSDIDVFIRLWPQNCGENTGDEEIVQYIMKRAEQTSQRLMPFEEQTQLEAVVGEIAAAAQKNGLTAGYKLWLPALPQMLTLSQINGYSGRSFDGYWSKCETEFTLETVIGVLDDPYNQAQLPLYLDFARGGNHAVLGSVACGKSTFLQTAVYGLVNAYTPQQLNVYIIDYSSRMLSIFDSLPHIGGVVYEGETDKTEKLFLLLDQIISERKKVLKGGTYSEYVRLNKNAMPAVLLVIDNYAGFKDKTDGKFEAQMLQISREGIGYGVFLLISAAGFGLSEIPSKMGDNIRTVFTLELPDKFKYADALHISRADVLPESGVKGRGLVKYGGRCLEYQTALINDCPNDYSRGQAAQKLFENMKQQWKSPVARRIPEIPENPTFALLKKESDFVLQLHDPKKLPIGYSCETASVYGLDLSQLYCFLIMGSSRYGKRSLPNILLNSCLLKDNAQIAVYSKNDSFSAFKDTRITFIHDDKGLFNYFKELTPQFVERNKKKHEFLHAGLETEEVFEKMQMYKPIFIFIDNFSDFIKSVYTPSDGINPMKGFVENIFDKGALHNIYIFSCCETADALKLGAYKAFGLFTKERKGALVGTSVSSQRILDFGRISYTEAGRVPDDGTILIADGGRASSLCKVVLPSTER